MAPPIFLSSWFSRLLPEKFPERIKLAWEVIRDADKIPLQSTVIGLHKDIETLAKEKAGLQASLNEANQRIIELKEKFKFQEELEFDDPYLVIKGKKGKKVHYCLACWREHLRAVEIVSVEHCVTVSKECPVCKHIYDESFLDPL